MPSNESISAETERWGAVIRDTKKKLSSFNQVALAELLRRSEISAAVDGHAGNRRPRPGGHGHSELTATEASALSGLTVKGSDDWSHHDPIDPQGDALVKMFACLKVAARLVERAEFEQHFVLSTGKGAKEREGRTTVCTLCGGIVGATPASSDRIVSGLGPKCYKDWDGQKTKFEAKYGKADAFWRWKHVRLEQLSAGEKPQCGQADGHVTARAKAVHLPPGGEQGTGRPPAPMQTC